MTFTTQVQKQNTRDKKSSTLKTEMEAQSQTDFAPLLPLDPTQFSLDALQGNYNTNLMFVPEETDGSVLQEMSVSIAGQIAMGGIQQDVSMIPHTPGEDTNHPYHSQQYP